MRKTITYTGFTVASIIVILLFLTAKTYTQLGVAVLLYPIVAILALNLIPRRKKNTEIAIQLTSKDAPTEIVENVETKSGKVEIADIDKRAFLKLIGAAGLSFFIFSILSKRAEVPFFGKMVGPSTPGTTTLTDIDGTKIDPARRQPMDGFQISEIDDNVVAYYGFTNKEGAWLIMKEDTDNNSFRYARGESNFTDNWGKREQVKYGYFHEVFKLGTA